MPTANQSPGKVEEMLKTRHRWMMGQFTCWTISEREDLRAEVVLLQLTAFPQVPRPHRVVQPTRPQFCTIRTYVYARRAIRVPLELSHKRLVLEIPHGDVSVAAA